LQDFILSIENALLHLAESVTPEGTLPRAVIHQWIFAIAFEKKLYAQNKNITAEKIIKILTHASLFTDLETFKRMIRKTVIIKPSSTPTFTFIDLFAGIGGMRIGFQNAGGNCVFSSEFEKNAQETYYVNHGDFPFGDITKIPVKDIPDHDVLVGGFPCQPFSHAGLKLGIEDTRGTLFHNIAQILEVKRPKFALLENVKGLISHDKGFTLQVILRTLTRIGYKCSIDKEIIEKGSLKQIQAEAKKMVLKSINFGVPQNRQRIYIVLWRDDIPTDFQYPTAIGTKTRVGDILEKDPDPKYTISDKLWAGHQRRKAQNEKDGKGFGFGLVTHESPYTNTISARYYKDGSEILVAQDNKNPRKLTPREAANLQGFPEIFKYSKSSVQAYKQFGNSVSVPVISILAKTIEKNIRKQTK
jgi:DNA (cytosine-5)-methyltransferase 1